MNSDSINRTAGPRGDKGDKGDRGDKGDKGDKCDRRDPGIQGPPSVQVEAGGSPIVAPNLDTTNLEQSFNGLSKSMQDIMEAQHDVSLSMQSIQAEHVNAIKELTQTTQHRYKVILIPFLMILRNMMDWTKMNWKTG